MMRSFSYIVTGCVLLVLASLIYFAMDHPRDVTLMIDGQEQQVETTETSVYGVLRENGIDVQDEDAIEPALSADLPDDGLIVMQRAKEITLIVGYGQAQTVRTQARLVEDLLKEQGIARAI